LSVTAGAPGQGIGAAVRRAAEAEDVAPDGPLGRVLAALADLGDRMEAAAERAEAAVERRARDLELARDGAEAAAEAARLAVVGHKAQADAALVELVDGIKEQIGPATKDWRVVKTRIHGAQRIGLVAGAGAVAAVVFLGAGAAFVAWRDRDAVRFHAACARKAVHDARGRLYCPMRAVLAEDGSGR
jgi:hypothetical protein